MSREPSNPPPLHPIPIGTTVPAQNFPLPGPVAGEIAFMDGDPDERLPFSTSPSSKRGFREALKESPSRPDGKFIRAIDDNVVTTLLQRCALRRRSPRGL